MASERFVAALTAQIAHEFAAAHQYVAIGNYYSAETYPQLSLFFYAQAEEEREHAMKMVNYLIDRGVQPDIGGVESPKGSFGDHASEQFMQWFLEEQVEEEAAMGDLLAVAERTVSVPMLLEEYLARDKPGARPD